MICSCKVLGGANECDPGLLQSRSGTAKLSGAGVCGARGTPPRVAWQQSTTHGQPHIWPGPGRSGIPEGGSRGRISLRLCFCRQSAGTRMAAYVVGDLSAQLASSPLATSMATSRSSKSFAPWTSTAACRGLHARQLHQGTKSLEYECDCGTRRVRPLHHALQGSATGESCNLTSVLVQLNCGRMLKRGYQQALQGDPEARTWIPATDAP